MIFRQFLEQLSKDFGIIIDTPKQREEETKKDNIEIIFNDPATILIINGKKYICKAQGEPFDEEKGLALTLLKASGISYLDLKKLLKNAKRPQVKTKKETVEVAPKKRGRPKTNK